MAEAKNDEQVIKFFTGLRGHIYATVVRDLKSKNLDTTYETVLATLRAIKWEWESDTSDTSREKLLYIAIMKEEIEKIEQKLAA